MKEKKSLRTFYYLISSLLTEYVIMDVWVNDYSFPLWTAQHMICCRTRQRCSSYLELHLFSVFWEQYFTVRTQSWDSWKLSIPTASGKCRWDLNHIYTTAHKLSGGFPSSHLATSEFLNVCTDFEQTVPNKIHYFLYSKRRKKGMIESVNLKHVIKN